MRTRQIFRCCRFPFGNCRCRNALEHHSISTFTATCCTTRNASAHTQASNTFNIMHKTKRHPLTNTSSRQTLHTKRVCSDGVLCIQSDYFRYANNIFSLSHILSFAGFWRHCLQITSSSPELCHGFPYTFWRRFISIGCMEREQYFQLCRDAYRRDILCMCSKQYNRQ